MKKISIHDNFVKGYCVSCDKQTIVMHTELRDGNMHETTDVVFHEVEAYFFYYDNMHSILFDIEECGVKHILNRFKDEFADGVDHCWPGTWNKSIESCREYLEQQQYRAWVINPSYGMGGFVIAKDIELKTAV